MQVAIVKPNTVVVAAHYKKDDLLHCWTSSRIFPTTMRTRHCRSRAGARHSMCELTYGMAWERHSICKSAFKSLHKTTTQRSSLGPQRHLLDSRSFGVTWLRISLQLSYGCVPCSDVGTDWSGSMCSRVPCARLGIVPQSGPRPLPLTFFLQFVIRCSQQSALMAVIETNVNSYRAVNTPSRLYKPVS